MTKQNTLSHAVSKKQGSLKAYTFAKCVFLEHNLLSLIHTVCHADNFQDEGAYMVMRGKTNGKVLCIYTSILFRMQDLVIDQCKTQDTRVFKHKI